MSAWQVLLYCHPERARVERSEMSASRRPCAGTVYTRGVKSWFSRAREHDAFDMRGTIMKHALRSALVFALLGVTPALLAQIPAQGLRLALISLRSTRA